MRQRLLLSATTILLVITQAVGQSSQEFNEMIYYVPAGLTVQKTGNSMILTDPTLSNGQFYTITVNRSTFSLKKIEKTLPVYWRETLMNEGVDNPAEEPDFVRSQTNSGWNYFRGGRLVQYNPQTPLFYYHLTIMRYAGITVNVATRASSEDIFTQRIPWLMQLVSSVAFKQTPQQANRPPVSPNQNYPPVQTGTGTSVSQPSKPLSGLYISLQGDLLANAELSVLYFSPDGTVYTDIPDKGYYNLNMQEQKTKYPSLFGTYTATGNTVSVRMNQQAGSAVYSIGTDGSLHPSANTSPLFRKMESLDNYLFEGTFINRQATIPGVSLVFNRDGRFTDNGLIQTILSTGNPSSAPGIGTYNCRQNSLFLQFADGRQLQLCFYIMPEDYAKAGAPGKILINNYLLLKQ